MDIEEVRKYCLSRPRAEESTPFGEDNLVFKVDGKIFLIMNLNSPFSINVKCDPERAVELRERYDAIQPGYHMNKKHWNTIMLNYSLSPALIRESIDHSYFLVARKHKSK